MASGGVYPLLLEKFVRKQKKSIEFVANVVKYSWTTFEIIFEPLAALKTIIGGVQESHDFRGFLRISQRGFNISS